MMTPLQRTVYSHLVGYGAMPLSSLRSELEASTRHVGYAIERAALELVEAGECWQAGAIVGVKLDVEEVVS